MRLIDADVLKVKQQEDADLFIGDDTLSGKSRRDEALNAVANIINAPTVDAVEVVRCKDCRFSHMTYSGECKSCDKWVDDDDFHLTLYLDGDFYCAFGERKDETN